MLTSTIDALMTNVSPAGDASERCRDKITVIGAGTVGTAIAFSLLAQVRNHIVSYYFFTNNYHLIL